MVVALFDEASDEIIFTSTGSKKVSTANMDPDEAQTYANQVVAEILKDFPPGG
jgi:hypothetical protein